MENKKKINVGYIVAKLITSIMIGFSYFLDSMLVFNNEPTRLFWGHTNHEEVYFIDPTLKSFILLFIVSVFSYLIITILGKIGEKIKEKFWVENPNKKNDYTFIFIFLALFVMWLPYILTFFPGGYDCNSAYVIREALGLEKITNHYPVFYTFIMWAFLSFSNLITGANQFGYTLLSILQVVFMISMISYFIYWWYKKGVNKWIVIVLTLCFGLFKLYPIYALTVWKETPFSLLVILLTFNILDIVLSKGEKLKDNKFIALYILTILLISFLRNNGMYIVIPTTICIYFVYRKYKKFILLTLITMLIPVIIQIPIFNALNINSEYEEKIGVPLQQISYVLTYEGNITDEQMEYLDSIVSIKRVKAYYNPFNVDYVKFDCKLNVENIENNKLQFYKTWLELFVQNPEMYIKAYLLNITGFWNINRLYNWDLKDYANPVINPADYDCFNIRQQDLIYRATGRSIEQYLYKFNGEQQISTAIFIFLTLISLTYIFKTKKYRFLLIYLPTLLTLGTLLIATPIAFGLRYVYPVVIFVPISFLIPFLKIEEKNEENQIKE